jgi:hypothetical protein
MLPRPGVIPRGPVKIRLEVSKIPMLVFITEAFNTGGCTIASVVKLSLQIFVNVHFLLKISEVKN